MTVVREWSGRAVMQARAVVITWLPAPCGQCGEPVHPADSWVVGHKIARAVRPDLTWEPSNWRPEHRSCSNKSAQSVVIEKARAEGIAATLESLGLTDQALPGMPSFPSAPTPGQPSPLPFSLPSSQPQSFTIPDNRTWAYFVQTAPEWLAPHLDLDENSNPPLAISPLHPDAVGSYGLPNSERAFCPEGAVAWIGQAEGKPLRWWQALGIILKLQHDAEGRLLKRIVTETGPRRAGKSVGLRGLALWRMEFGHQLFGERQEIIHTGSDLSVCRKAQKSAWRWAQRRWGAKAVTMGNGKESIERPDDGSVWMVRAQEATYGWDTTLGIVDEGWDVKPDTVSEGIEPSLIGRRSPQLVMTSTSHRRATSTMRTALATALDSDDPKILLMWWGAKPDDDPADPAVWKAASPYWDDERAEFVASMYAKALAGEQDPEFDDPDPLRGFACQYANLWNLKQRRLPGEALIEPDAWQALAAPAPAAVPAAVAVESWFGAGVSVASAWPMAGGRVVVSVTACPDLAHAAAAAAATGYRGPLIIGASHAEDPAFRGRATDARRGGTAQAAHGLQRLMGADLIRHDGTDHLSGQVETLRITPGLDGPRVVSKARADAVKAAVWAAEAARSRPARSRPVRLITAAD